MGSTIAAANSMGGFIDSVSAVRAGSSKSAGQVGYGQQRTGRESVQCEASMLLADPSLQGGKRGGGVAAHPGAEQPQQWAGPALDIRSLHHPDKSSGCRLEQVLEGDRAQRHRAFANPPPPRIDRGDGEGPAEVA